MRQSHIPNKQRKIPRIKQLHIRNPLVSDDSNLAAKDIDQAGKDERVCHQGCRAELGQVTDETHGEEYHKLNEDEILDGDVAHTVSYAPNEGL
jgi:hypothetical protein